MLYVETDRNYISQEQGLMSKIKGKVILITGGTGSFGNAVVKKLLPLNPKAIYVFSRDELKQEIMRNEYNNPILNFVIGDIRDKTSVDKAMCFGIDYVFHAAALKQVPAGETFPMEYIKTNIIGADNVMQSAEENGVEKVVILSTDKAVYPVNAMGMSKALMEKLMISYSQMAAETIYCGVRYGNVLYSRGSVLPFFVSLIKQNKPLEVTNPDMTRFLLPLTDAADLVLETLESGKNGQMYVRRSPACTIEYLAKALCIMFNHKKGYVIVGAREGEKTHETLIASEDTPLTSENTQRLNVTEIIDLLKTLPEIQQVLKYTNDN